LTNTVFCRRAVSSAEYEKNTCGQGRLKIKGPCRKKKNKATLRKEGFS